MAGTYDEETKRQLENRRRNAELRRAEMIRRRNNMLLMACGIIVILIFVIVIFKSCGSDEAGENNSETTAPRTTVEMTTVEPTTVAKVMKKTKDNVNFRRRMKISDNNIIDTLPKGTEVEVLDESDLTWAKISYGGKTGYVSKEFLE